ncbi:MAG: hypothetical protein V3W37_07610 [Candidatus Binatia bacterium]
MKDPYAKIVLFKGAQRVNAYSSHDSENNQVLIAKVEKGRKLLVNIAAITLVFAWRILCVIIDWYLRIGHTAANKGLFGQDPIDP